MSETPASNTVHEFDCPLCEGSFEVETQWLGQTIPCPHCDGDVGLPTAEEMGVTPAEPVPAPVSAPVPAQPAPPPQQPRAAEPPRKLTVEERAAVRRKINLILAVVGALIVTIVFVILAQLG